MECVLFDMLGCPWLHRYMRIFQLIGVFLLLVSFLAIGAIVDVSFVDATYPGYNGKILIQSNRDGNNELYVVEGDGSNPINVTNNSASDISGRWSPDGRQILYTSNRDGNNEIYSMNADGSSVERITNNPSSDISFGWSPDGTKILFQSMRSGEFRLWYMNADGSN